MFIENSLEKLLKIFPPYIVEAITLHHKKNQLIEIVFDVGRRPEGRFINGIEYISTKVFSWQDMDYILKRLGEFNRNNRIGVERSLNRISCIKNRQNIIIGLTCRIGRTILGNVSTIADILNLNKSVLILGKPGLGKTTIIREISRVLADEKEKRVVIIDSSNEIAGDNDIPHLGIGRARRMQVSKTVNQDRVMIEAVENHMPEIIIIDEISTEMEACAARTIAERGVLLVGTAHATTLESLIKNSYLNELVGGIQFVVLSDEEAKRRRTQKTILERKTFSSFQVVVELNHTYRWTIYDKIEQAVDLILSGKSANLQIRSREQQQIKIKYNQVYSNLKKIPLKKKITTKFNSKGKTLMVQSLQKDLHFRTRLFKIYPYYLSLKNFKKIHIYFRINFILTTNINRADLILTSKSGFKNQPNLLLNLKIPIYNFDNFLNKKKNFR